MSIKYKTVICPDCWQEQEVDEDDDVFLCEQCEYQFEESESVH